MKSTPSVVLINIVDKNGKQIVDLSLHEISKWKLERHLTPVDHKRFRRYSWNPAWDGHMPLQHIPKQEIPNEKRS